MGRRGQASLTDEQVALIRKKFPDPEPIVGLPDRSKHANATSFKPGQSGCPESQFQNGISVNPGGAISPRNKRVRQTLMRLLDMSPNDFNRFVPTNMYEKVAVSLIKACYEGDGKFSTVVNAIMALIDRVDGKVQPSEEELESNAAPKFIIGTIARPQF